SPICAVPPSWLPQPSSALSTTYSPLTYSRLARVFRPRPPLTLHDTPNPIFVEHFVPPTPDPRRPTPILLIRPPVHRICYHLRLRHRRGIKRCLAPTNFHREPREIDDASVAAIARQVVRRPHEDAIDRARLDAQRTKHALAVVDRKAGDLEALAVLDPLLANIDAIDRASLRTLIARNARRQ